MTKKKYKKYFDSFLSLVKRQKKNIIISFIISIAISFVCYLMNNIPYPYWDSLGKYSKLEFFLRNITSQEVDNQDVFFINVSYDKQIADYTFDNGNSKGKIAVTDREKLIRFLHLAKEANYKYIFLDIRFEKGVYCPQDKELKKLIDSMDRISFSSHSDIITNDEFVSQKAAINDFYTTITSTNFTRYQFLQNDKESAPLRIYLATHPDAKTIERHGIFYTCDGKLCQNSPFMTVSEDFKSIYEGTGSDNYFHLGPDLFDPEQEVSDEDIQEAIDGKIVIVGDFVSDLHDTYSGMQPGSYLVYLAYKELVNGKHFLAWPFIILMTIIYFFISLFILNKKSLWSFIPIIKRVKSKLFLFILNLFGFSTILSVVTIIMYISFRATYNIFFPTVFFSLLSLIISYKKS